MSSTATNMTVTELRDAIAAKQLSAVEATRGFLDRIHANNPYLNAFYDTYTERALQRAAAVDAGEVTGALAGVPIAIKDNLCTTFGRTTCSSRMLENFRAPYTATAVEKLEAAGAVVLGKTVLDEFAMGSSTENSAFGVVRNPWNTDCVPGGSSGGSAVAVAAQLAAAGIGSDTGGSIRQPAALCGVVGMKPTYGRISRWGLIAFASSLDQIGPFTHTVTDAAAMLQAMAGQDPLDSTSAPVDVPDYTAQLDEPIAGLRIGLAKQYMAEGNHPAVTAAVNDAVEVYQRAGATVVEVDLPHTDYGIPVYYIVATAEASSNLARYDGVHYGYRAKDPDDLIDLYARSRAEGFGEEVQRRIMLGTYALSSGYHDAYYVRALKVRRLIMQAFIDVFTRCHVILCPTSTGPAFRIGEKADDPLTMYLNDIYTVNGNLTGLPGISLPAGLSDEGLPVAVQLFGPAFEEARLLRAARMYEAGTEHHRLRPRL